MSEQTRTETTPTDRVAARCPRTDERKPATARPVSKGTRAALRVLHRR